VFEGLTQGWGLWPVAFAAGAVSFLSPCVLPLVPGYLSYMSGVSATEGDRRVRTRRTVVAAFAFVAGFTLIFVPLGATFSLLGAFLDENRALLTRIGGVFIIAMGLVFMGVIKVPFLYQEARFHPRPGAGTGGGFLMGAAFAFGWSPCIGPVLAVILTMAAGGGSRGGPLQGALLLTVYSLGLGLPFVLSGLGTARMTRALAWFRRHTRAVMTTSGALLVVMGVLFLTDRLFEISIWMQRGLDKLGLDFLARI
jgi:cytochrome c-type biogenesis protein